MGLASGLSASLIAAGPVAAQFVLEPDWSRRPDQADVNREYPKLAEALALQGRAVLSCDVTATGSLASCSVVEETPTGLGFREAALRMSRSFQMRPGIQVRRGAPHGNVRIPIAFRLPALDAAPSPPPLSPRAKALATRLVASADPASGFLAHYEAQAARLKSASTPGVPREAGEEAGKAILTAARAKAPVVRQMLGEAIAARLTEAELTQFADFAESSTGKLWFGVDPGLRDMRREADQENQKLIRAEARRIFCANRGCASAPRETLSLGTERPLTNTIDPDAPLPYAPWGQLPDIRETIMGWPIAFLFGINGYARFVCTVGLQGGAEDCDLAYESPQGLGVGEAAGRLTERYRMRPDMLANFVGKRVSIGAFFPASPLPDEERKAAIQPELPGSSHLALARRVVELQAQHSGKPQNPADKEGLRKILAPLTPDLQSEAEAALIAASDGLRPALLEDRARSLTNFYDQESLRNIARFEEALRPAIARAIQASEAERHALGKVIGDEVATMARESFCRNRDCTAPVFDQPRPISEASARQP